VCLRNISSRDLIIPKDFWIGWWRSSSGPRSSSQSIACSAALGASPAEVTEHYPKISTTRKAGRRHPALRPLPTSRRRRCSRRHFSKEPAIGDGCQSGEVRTRNVSRFAGGLCVAIHTRTGAESYGPEPAPFSIVPRRTLGSPSASPGSQADRCSQSTPVGEGPAQVGTKPLCRNDEAILKHARAM